MKRVLFLLGHLSNQDIEWMIRNGEKKSVGKNITLIHQGKQVENLYIVLSGKFRVLLGKEDVHEITTLSSGEVMGEMSLIEKKLPSVNVVASETSEVFSIPIRLIEERMAENLHFKSDFYLAIALFLSNRLRKTTDQLGYADPNEVDELDYNILDNVADAGSKFMEVLQKYSEV